MYRAPDLNKNRYRAKVTSVLNKRCYERFMSENPDIPLSYEEFKNIIGVHTNLLKEAIFNNIDGVDLPKRLGSMFMAGCSAPNKKNVDFVKSEKLNKIVDVDLIHTKEVKLDMSLNPKELQNLINMTPFKWKINNKLEKLLMSNNMFN